MNAARFLALAILTWLPVSLSAQVSSDKGWFTADFNAGCAPFSITIEHTGVRSGSLFIDFFGDPADQFSGTGFSDTFIAGESRTSATPYTTAGTFLIRVVDQSGTGSNQDRFDFLEITVTEPTTPVFSLGLCNNNQVLLTFDFAQDNYDSYEIDFGDGSPPATLDKTGGNTLPHAYPSESTFTINVSGRLNNGANSGCGDASPLTFNTLQVIAAPSIIDMTVLDATTMDFNYLPLLEHLAYRLEMSENGGAFTEVATLDRATNGSTFQYVTTLPNVDFNFGQYAFRLVAQEACTNSGINSTAVQNVRAGYMLNYVGTNLVFDRMWNTQDPESMLLSVDLWEVNGSPETQTLATSGINTTNIANCAGALPFYFEALFGGSISRSITVIPDPTTNNLTPPAPTGLAGQIAGGALQLTYDPAPFSTTEYRIYQVATSGTQLEQTSSGLSATISNFTLSDSEVCFQFTYVDECGHESAPSDPVCFQFTPSITLPTAFSPNGDGFNDTFSAPNGIFLNFNMEIYNRWGSLIFVTNDAAIGWDGNINGQPAPMGGYVYKINYNSGQGSPVSLTGSFTLIR